MNVLLDAKMISRAWINVSVNSKMLTITVHAEKNAKVYSKKILFVFIKRCSGGCPCFDCPDCWECTGSIECNKGDEKKVEI